jgi:hypothetical protein
MRARVLMGSLMDDGDVACFDGERERERETWIALEHLVAWHMAFGGPTFFTLR